MQMCPDKLLYPPPNAPAQAFLNGIVCKISPHTLTHHLTGKGKQPRIQMKGNYSSRKQKINLV